MINYFDNSPLNKELIVNENDSKNNPEHFIFEKLILQCVKDNSKIVFISASKTSLFVLMDDNILYLYDSKTFNQIKKFFQIPFFSLKSPCFENTKIWTDRSGNHSIIRIDNKAFYVNTLIGIKEVYKELIVSAVAFDDTIDDLYNTGLFLITDFSNSLYECNINIKINKNEYFIEPYIRKLTSFLEYISNEEDDEEDYYYLLGNSKKEQKEKILGIKFIKKELKKSSSDFENNKTQKNSSDCSYYYYIMIVTSSRFYQLIGNCLNKLYVFFQKYNRDSSLWDDTWMAFPGKFGKYENSNYSDLDFVYENDTIEQLGWKTYCGYCYSYINYQKDLPTKIKSFTVVPIDASNIISTHTKSYKMSYI
jgi:hypothetical protein